MKWIAALFLAFFSESVMADTCEEGGCINIGSYNIKLLGNGGPADTESEARQIVERIWEEADLDIVVLQEINIGSAEWSEVLLPIFEEHGYELTGAGDFGGTDPRRQQHVVLLHYADTIRPIGEVMDLDIDTDYEQGDCAYDGVRPPTVARYESIDSGQTFLVIGVHLKSQRAPNGVSWCDDEIREYQATVIADHIEAAWDNGDGDEVVLLGDYNAEFDAPEYAVLRDMSLATLIDAECDEQTLQGCTYLLSNYAGVIDHIAAYEDSALAVWGSGQVDHPNDIRRYLRSQSDHALVWASFRTQAITE